MNQIKTFGERYTYSLILLKEFVKTDFKLKYQGSVLGYAWTLLRPLALFIVLYVVFVKFLRVGESVPHFPNYLLLGIVLWNFFSDLTNGAIGSVVSRGDLIRKISFPKYVIVIATSVSALINLLINMIIIFLFMTIFGADPSLEAIAVLPLAILLLFVLGMGIGFILASLFVNYRDVNYIWEVVMQAGFYATPVLYPLQIMPESAQKILMINPAAVIIQEARKSMITEQTITAHSLYGGYIGYFPMIIVILICLFGFYIFRKKSKNFAEDI